MTVGPEVAQRILPAQVLNRTIRSPGKSDALLAYMMLKLGLTEKYLFFRTTCQCDQNFHPTITNNPY